MNIIVDSTIWIDWIRRRIEPKEIVLPWIEKGTCYTCGVIQVEVLRGILSNKLKDKFTELFSIMNYVHTSRELWEEISETAWSLDRKGKVVPVPDLIIAQCAKISGSTLITLDKDFKLIPGLKLSNSLLRKV